MESGAGHVPTTMGHWSYNPSRTSRTPAAGRTVLLETDPLTTAGRHRADHRYSLRCVARRPTKGTGPELLQRILGEVRERLAASSAAAEEYRRLERALEALGAAAAARPKPAAAPRRAVRRAPRAAQAGSTRARSAANRDRLLSVIGDRPGVTRAELPAATGLSGASVAQGLRRAIAAGRVRERELPGGQTGYALVPAGESDAPAAGIGPAGAAAASGDATVPGVTAEEEPAAADGDAGVTAPDAEAPADAAAADPADVSATDGAEAPATGDPAATAADADVAAPDAEAETAAASAAAADATPPAAEAPGDAAATGDGPAAAEVAETAPADAASETAAPAAKPTRRRTTRTPAKRAPAKPRTRRAKPAESAASDAPAPPAGGDDGAGTPER